MNDFILKLAKANGGTITTAFANKHDIKNATLAYWLKKGLLEKTERGVYVLAEHIEDEFITFQSVYKKGIYSLQSALFLLSLTDRMPYNFSMTFPARYNISSPKRKGIFCTQVTESLYSYNYETLLAEKIETIISRSTENTRMRDFYDVFIFLKLKSTEINLEILKSALNRTSQKRGTERNLSEWKSVLNALSQSSIMQTQWTKYAKTYSYAKNIHFSDCVLAIEGLLEMCHIN